MLEQASHTEDSFLRVLGELDYASAQLIEATENNQDLLDKRLLWVRSGLPLGLYTFKGLPQAILWAAYPPNWIEVGQVLLYEAVRSPLFWFLLLTTRFRRWV